MILTLASCVAHFAPAGGYVELIDSVAGPRVARFGLIDARSQRIMSVVIIARPREDGRLTLTQDVISPINLRGEVEPLPPITRATRSSAVPAPGTTRTSTQLRPPFPSYASCATSSENGSVCRAIRRGPASTASKPSSRIKPAATPLPLSSSP
jgi:hypothetical protein